MTDKQKELAIQKGYMGLFSHRDTIQEAYDYAINTAETLAPFEKAAMMVAIQVLVNTYAIILAKEECPDD